jgi:hypothetical protein
MRKTFIGLMIFFGFSLSLSAQDSQAQQYVEAYKDLALKHMIETGCPASIILAIAMHESAHGNSRVATHLNNHFGIKGPNSSTAIRSAYRGYASVEDSYADFIRYLKERKSTQGLFEKLKPFEYQAWARGIQRAGYAQSSSWATKVIHMIEKYDLHLVDKMHPFASEWDDASESQPAVATKSSHYTVKKGDTLSHIARKYHLSVKTLMQLNKLNSTHLRIGQRLLISNET